MGGHEAMTRPATLADAAIRIRGGVDQSIAIPEFLDTFYLAGSADERVAMMCDEPPLTGDARIDALVGAICEYLAKRYELPVIAGWASDPVRFLAEPWFTCAGEDDGMREFLTFSSPAEFRHRNIMTEAEPLRRASQHTATGQLR